MKRCPKCNRAYATDTQKFCTHDGGLLFMVDESLTETVQFDSAKVRDKVSHPTTRDLGEPNSAAVDPEATVISSPVAQSAPPPRARDTGNLEPPQQTQYYGAPPSTTSSVSPSAPAMVSAPPPSAPAPPQPAVPSAPLTETPPAQAPVTPPPAATPSGPIAPPAAQAAAASAQPSQPLAAAPKKKSKLPLILGLVAIVLVLFVGAAVAAAYFFVIRPRQVAQVEKPTVTTEPATAPGLPTNTATPAEVSQPANEPPPYNPPADAVQFTNSQDGLSGKLAENFVAFSFYYPNRWVKVPSSENFVTVERRLPPDFTQENFGIAPWYAPGDTTTFDDSFFKTLVEKDDAGFSRKFPEYRKVSEGPTKVGTYDAYEFRFEGMSRGTDKGDLTLWGREIFFPPRAGEKTGVKFLILTTSLAPEVKSIDDVGVKGELPMILESFRFGK
jgi:hypothetical protein